MMTKKRYLGSESLGGLLFDGFNILFLAAAGFVTVAPFIYILTGSFATELELLSRPFFLWPKTFSTAAYKYIFSNDSLVRSILNTVFVTVVGTIVQLICTFTMAYPLSKKLLPGRSLFMKLIIFSMLFSGGLIPTYLVVRGLGMVNTFWALIFPVAVSPFNLIIIKNFFQSFPEELLDAGEIDGCTEMGKFIRIVMPLSKAVLATFTLFYAVGLWNNFFNAFIYLTDSSKWTLQIILRQLVLMSDVSVAGETSDIFFELPKEGIKLATIAVATAPILVVYPFIQKHFAKGMMIGGIKG